MMILMMMMMILMMMILIMNNDEMILVMMVMMMVMVVQRCLACGQVGDPRLMENKVEILSESVDQKESKGENNFL